jgi:hypothetical protein
MRVVAARPNSFTDPSTTDSTEVPRLSCSSAPVIPATGTRRAACHFWSLPDLRSSTTRRLNNLSAAAHHRLHGTSIDTFSDEPNGADTGELGKFRPRRTMRRPLPTPVIGAVSLAALRRARAVPPLARQGAGDACLRGGPKAQLEVADVLPNGRPLDGSWPELPARRRPPVVALLVAAPSPFVTRVPVL